MKSSLHVRRVALLAGAVLLSASAMARPLSDAVITRTEAVKYSVADVATSTGAADLYSKLQTAAAKVCSDTVDSYIVLDRQFTYADCMATALDKAVADVGSPMLTAVHMHNMKKDVMTVAQR